MERRVWGSKKTPFLTCAKSGGFGASRSERSEPSVWEPSDVPKAQGKVGKLGRLKCEKKTPEVLLTQGFGREAYHFNVSESLISLGDDIPTA